MAVRLIPPNRFCRCGYAGPGPALKRRVAAVLELLEFILLSVMALTVIGLLPYIVWALSRAAVACKPADGPLHRWLTHILHPH